MKPAPALIGYPDHSRNLVLGPFLVEGETPAERLRDAVAKLTGPTPEHQVSIYQILEREVHRDGLDEQVES